MGNGSRAFSSSVSADVQPRSDSTDYKEYKSKEDIKSHPKVRKTLWGGEFWSGGFMVGRAGERGDEKVLRRYIRNQGRNPGNYQKTHEGKHLELFPYQNKA
jgi:hypothetical protein